MPKGDFTVPVYSLSNGSILLYDMYVDGGWIGSRRTFGQCLQAFRNFHGIH